MTLELDAKKREVEPPQDLVSALKAKPPAWQRWQELSYSHRREYVKSIEGAKKAETRTRRREAAAEAIAAKLAKPQSKVARAPTLDSRPTKKTRVKKSRLNAA